ncbi:MAG: hypothetical protein ACOQNY_01410 [Mycoplasmoidaceae bacterium]
MEQNLTKTQKVIKWFNKTGFIHTLISVVVFAMSLVNYLAGKYEFYLSIQILSVITLFNSLIWIICGLLLIILAGRVHVQDKSVAKVRWTLFLSLWFVLTPDILMVVLFYLPWLKTADWINFIGMVSPLLVFIGWFMGKHLAKKMD